MRWYNKRRGTHLRTKLERRKIRSIIDHARRAIWKLKPISLSNFKVKVEQEGDIMHVQFSIPQWIAKRCGIAV